jgi:hypothetical protein
MILFVSTLTSGFVHIHPFKSKTNTKWKQQHMINVSERKTKTLYT